jgi:hypothetical protein
MPSLSAPGSLSSTRQRSIAEDVWHRLTISLPFHCTTPLLPSSSSAVWTCHTPLTGPMQTHLPASLTLWKQERHETEWWEYPHDAACSLLAAAASQSWAEHGDKLLWCYHAQMVFGDVMLLFRCDVCMHVCTCVCDEGCIFSIQTPCISSHFIALQSGIKIDLSCFVNNTHNTLMSKWEKHSGQWPT